MLTVQMATVGYGEFQEIVPSKGALGESQMEATEQEESELGV